ncbi:arylsulfatase [Pontibacter sp. G13]|uniref:sulfatase family protein n=1 Tax=Pontibacter sp. G13 TaxID=3074898 RepID=UPI00288AA89D|nr:arylsulfatase [Pontibacter sp. G13]WNJ17913.1 arylsulfatase [Pontibacter sp. G13]
MAHAARIFFPLAWICTLILSGCSSSNTQTASPALPNIVVFYVDDLGYGDLGVYGAQGVETPEVDRIAQNGLMFTDAHSSAATCTPSRFSLLTGIYAFRNQARVLEGDAPLLIDPEGYTLPKMLQAAGYATGVVGKWHLGLGNGSVDWNQEIKPGPAEVGFDYSFLIPATGDRVPTVYTENGHVIGLDPEDPIKVSYKGPVGDRPIGLENPELLRQGADEQHAKTIVNGISRIGYMEGGEKALWVDEEFPDVLNEKAIDFIDSHEDKPFFLYYSYHDIHVPRLPNPRFKGKSTMGPRGDAIAQMDWMTGQIVRELEERGLAENTLIIFTSDNGPVLNDGYMDQSVDLLGDHKPAGPFRGGKYSAYEAGTRVPTIAYWPGNIQPGKSNALMTQVDIYASIAALIGHPLATDEAIDSENHLEAWLGTTQTGRQTMLEESYTLSLRTPQWKYIEPVPKGKGFGWIKRKGIEGGFEQVPQLFELTADEGEQENLAETHPELVVEFQQQIDDWKARTQRTQQAQ